MSDKRRWLDDFLHDDFLHIEASKDLLRLHQARTEKERMDILERLLYCPNIDYSYLLHSKIGRSTEMIDISSRPTSVTYKDRLVFGKSKLTKKETQLLLERRRLEQAGELNYTRYWTISANG